jgi:hypothetical protein
MSKYEKIYIDIFNKNKRGWCLWIQKD